MFLLWSAEIRSPRNYLEFSGILGGLSFSFASHVCEASQWRPAEQPNPRKYKENRMKTSLKTLALIVTLSVSSLASAQQLGIHLGLSPQGLQPSLTFTGQPQSGSLMGRVRQPRMLNPYQLVGPGGTWNPVVEASQPKLGGFSYDPVTGRLMMHTESHEVRASALDPNRHIVDPGSRRAKSTTSTDAHGNVYVEEVVSWTSYGVPHSKTTRRLVRQGNGRMGSTHTNTTHAHTHTAVSFQAPSN